MEIVRLAPDVRPPWPRAAVTVGNFDGIHLGHRALVRAAADAAATARIASVVLTFDPHPSRVLAPHRAPEALVTFDQKAEIVGRLGVDFLAVLPFDRELAGQSADAFARAVLVELLRATTVVVGAGFRFGRERRGDVSLLTTLGSRSGFEVQAVAPVLHDGQPISSTRIRDALARGSVEAAARMLGRDYFIDGSVIEGARRGRTLGFPTANLRPFNECVPGGGVYAGWCRPAGASERTAAVVNVGRRPTFGGGDIVVEAHLLDFSGDLYGRELRLEFHRKLRDERAFSGPEALRTQIAADVAEARRALPEP